MFEQLWQSWVKALTEPKVETYDKEKPLAAMDKAIIGFVIAGVVAGITSALWSFVGGRFLEGIVSIILSPIFAIVGLYVFSYIMIFVAKQFGGVGSLEEQTYLVSIVLVPASVASSIVGLVPSLGGLVGAMISLYALYPLTLAVQSVHKVDVGKAILIWLIPGIIVGVAVFIIVTILAIIGLGVALVTPGS